MDESRKAKLLEKIKALAPIHNGMDGARYEMLLELNLERLLNAMANYLNRPLDELPATLDSEIALHIVDWLTTNRVLFTDDELAASEAPVASISEGDTSTSFAVKAVVPSEQTESDFISGNFKRTLNKYRRLASWMGN